jgi:uncharacterized protein
MDFSLDRPEGYLFVRRVDRLSITLIDREITGSFLLAPEKVVEQWPVHHVLELDEHNIQTILELKPELVLLGTGERQQFPSPQYMASFLRRGVGVEVMDNAAAARTYNLLASESRRVVAAFILPAA